MWQPRREIIEIGASFLIRLVFVDVDRRMIYLNAVDKEDRVILAGYRYGGEDCNTMWVVWCGETIAIIMGGTSIYRCMQIMLARGFGDGEGVSESVEWILDRKGVR